MKIKPGHVDFYKLSLLVCSFFGCEHKKTVYYNSVPSIGDGKRLYWSHMNFLKDLEKLPNFEVKTRKLQRTSTQELVQEKKETLATLDLCSKCRPIMESHFVDDLGPVKKREKGIDVMIAVDMLNLSTIENKCDCCILVSGDADFVPVLDLIKKHGKSVYSSSLTKGYSYELREKHIFKVLDKNTIIENCLK